jgi:hypothetical protein
MTFVDDAMSLQSRVPAVRIQCLHQPTSHICLSPLVEWFSKTHHVTLLVRKSLWLSDLMARLVLKADRLDVTLQCIQRYENEPSLSLCMVNARFCSMSTYSFSDGSIAITPRIAQQCGGDSSHLSSTAITFFSDHFGNCDLTIEHTKSHENQSDTHNKVD